MIKINDLTIKKAHAHLVNKDFSVLDLCDEYLKSVKEKDNNIHAFLEVFDDIKEQAENAQKIIDSGKSHILTGIPFSIKDNILIKGRKASSGSKILENYKATYDATVIKKLKDCGVVFIGRTNMDEFALGSSTENSAFGVTKNPFDENRVAGGTSGGSTASVSSGMVLGSLGSDTGGSVRQPASFCGVVGMKPTYGMVSRYGLMAAASSLDQIGPIAKNVTDAEIIFDAIKGNDSMDSTSLKDVDEKDTESKKVLGVPKKILENGGVDKNVLDNFYESIKRFEKLGYKIKEIDIPNWKYALAIYYIINFAEVSSNLSRFDGVKYGFYKSGKNLLEDYKLTRGEGFGKEARRRIMLGTYVLSSGYYDAYYNKANKARGKIKNDFKKVFEEVDAILTPTSPVPAFKIGEKSDDPLQMYLADIFTVTANIVGIPAISLPSGFSEIDGKKLPLGMQIMTDFKKEDVLFKLGKEFNNEL